MENNYLTPGQVCRQLEISYQFLLKLVNEKKIEYILLSQGAVRRFRFTQEAVAAYLESRVNKVV